MKTAPGVQLTPQDIFQLVAPDLQKVEIGLQTGARSVFPLVNHINEYLHGSGGKRLRPALVLLSSKLFEADPEAAVQLSVVVELIHVATLVHDDIIDNAHLRRGRPTVNAKWGNQVTVLMGDWLYMTSFHLALQHRKFQILDVLIDVTRNMVEGELMQLGSGGRTDITQDEHLDICLRKTACLFSACSQLGGILGDALPVAQEKLALYGRSLGMAFQLVDDLLDYTADESVLGKPVLKDLEEGKITLPIIYLLQRASRDERRFVHQVVARQDFSSESKRRIIQLVHAYGTLNELQELALRYAEQAQNSLRGFPDSIYREALIKVPEFVVNRQS